MTHLQAHHVWHWAHGGPTDPINLVLLCRTHHMLMHEGGFSIAWALGRPGTSWVVTDPTGCPVPEVRLFNPGPSTRFADSKIADPGPDAIRSSWAGERFRVTETCGVLLDNTLPRRTTSTRGDQVSTDGDPAPTDGDPAPTKEDPGDKDANLRPAETDSAHPPAAERHPLGITTSTVTALLAGVGTAIPKPTEASNPAVAGGQVAAAPPTRDEWFESIDLTGVSDEELVDGSYWRTLMDELVEAELAQAGPADVTRA